MAPKRRNKTDDDDDINEGVKVKPTPRSRTTSSRVKVNRSSSRTTTPLAEANSVAPPVEIVLPKNNKKAKTIKEKESAKPPASNPKVVVDAASNKTIVIEHCKQCNSFKTRAIQVKNGLEKGLSGITVLVNPEKPRRGCFEIREDGGQKFISLLEMKRPFRPMKELDMDKLIYDIVDQIN